VGKIIDHPNFAQIADSFDWKNLKKYKAEL